MSRPLLGPLGARFAAAFVAVALFAVAVFSAAVVVADQRHVSHLAAIQRGKAASEVTALVETAYRSAGGWVGIDLSPLIAFARTADVGIRVYDANGTLLESATAPGAVGADPPVIAQSALNVDGLPAGVVAVDFPNSGIRPGDSHLRTSLISAVGWSAALAVAAAVIVAVLLARGVVRPLRRLAVVAGSLKLGESSARVGPSVGPGELGELGRAFDAMADSLEEEDRLRRALVADVAHELRTPVAVMQAETEALSDGVTEPTPQALSSLHDEAVRLGRLVEDLQTLASAQAAALELDRRPLDLGRVGADAAQSLASRCQAGHVRLEQDLPPTPAIGDPYRLHQVAVNLLTNAIKFTAPGGTVCIRSYTHTGQAVLEVTDSGPGVAEGEREAIWERFYQGKGARPRSGSGIGLAVVKQLVDAHGGAIGLECPPSGGARFTVRIPASPGDARAKETAHR